MIYKKNLKRYNFIHFESIKAQFGLMPNWAFVVGFDLLKLDIERESSPCRKLTSQHINTVGLSIRHYITEDLAFYMH